MSNKQRKLHNDGIHGSSAAQTEIPTSENFVGFVVSNLPRNNNIPGLPGSMSCMDHTVNVCRLVVILGRREEFCLKINHHNEFSFSFYCLTG